jgi:hypothetical protein
MSGCDRTSALHCDDVVCGIYVTFVFLFICDLIFFILYFVGVFVGGCSCGACTHHSSTVWMLATTENALAGPIPAEIGQLMQLNRLDLTGNRLGGAFWLMSCLFCSLRSMRASRPLL